MPAGDYRSRRSSGGGRGGGSSSFYDDEGRGNSKDIWVWFSTSYSNNNFSDSWLFSITDEMCYRLIDYSRMRFNLEDIMDYNANHDSRAKRLINEHSKLWENWHIYVHEGHKRHKEKMRIANEEASKKWELESKRREAVRMELVEEQTNQYLAERELTAGALQSDLDAAWKLQESYGMLQGEFIDDIVGAGYHGDGFGEEIRQRSGIKLQITLSLDCSNSMYYNRISQIAKKAFRTVGLAMKKMQEEADQMYPGCLFTKFFLFSLGYEGKSVNVLTKNSYNKDDLEEFSGFRDVINTKDVYVHEQNWFSGEDTYISTLFSAIEKWESTSSDPGAIRLDLVITDAVLEHRDDIREANIIQERRDGNLQTVLLNFLPESDWLGSTLPRRCVQYHVDENNIDGMLRNVIHEFLAINM